jgi:SAM-dependent methyltransferase
LLPALSIKNLIQGKTVLHFAPERVIANLLRAESTKYVSADYCRDNVDMQIDMCNMKCIEDGAFDLVMACDVLEHVPDDSAALSELFRILAPRGWAILTVPQKDNLATKFEDSSLITPEERKNAFGRGDHLRIYGDDFASFLEHHGFSVTVVDERSFNFDVVKMHVLFPPVLSNNPLATNYRKVYFAQKLLS